jgi:hypothetical protein
MLFKERSSLTCSMRTAEANQAIESRRREGWWTNEKVQARNVSVEEQPLPG